MESLEISQLTALSHPQRLDLFRLLVRRYPDAVPAGEIARALKLKANTASVYLGHLLNAALVTKTRRGTSLLYRANMESADHLVNFLFSDCCRDRPQICVPQKSAGPIRKVLFVCTGNSARSLCAEAVLRDLAGDGIEVFSAGTAPAPQPNKDMLALLISEGHDVSLLKTEDISDLRKTTADSMDLVITLCDHAAHCDAATWPSHPLMTHWSLPPPGLAIKMGAAPHTAFQNTYRDIKNRIEHLLKIDFAALSRAEAQTALDAIGTQTKDTSPQ